MKFRGQRSWHFEAKAGLSCFSPLLLFPNYSNRSASVGFTAEARRAGMSAAPSAVEHRTKVAARIVTGSVGLTSYSCDSNKTAQRPDARQRDRCSPGDHHHRIAKDQPDGRKARRPQRQSNTDLARTLGHDERHHTVQANQREQERQCAEAAGKCRQHTLCVQGSVDLLVQRAEIADWQ